MARGAVRTGTPIWKNPKVLLTLAAIVFAALTAIAFCLGLLIPAAAAESTTINFGNVTYTSIGADTQVGALFTWLSSAGIAAGLLGVFLFIVGKQRGPAWGIAYFFGLALLGVGLGATLGYSRDDGFSPLFVSLAVLGLLVCLLHPLAEIRHARTTRLQENTKANGVRTTAEVKRVGLTNRDRINYWLIWLEYQDRQGRTFNIRHMLRHGTLNAPKVGQRYSIIYDPRHPGRRASVVVSGTSTSGGSSTSGQRVVKGRDTEFVHWRQPRR